MMELTDALDNNPFSALIYEVPEIKPEYGFFKRLSIKRKRRKHFKKEILPKYKFLRDNTASFETMCYYADFLKQMELAQFHNNSIFNRDNTSRASIKDNEKKNIIVCDNSRQKSTKEKILRIIMEKKNVTITFKLYLSRDDEEVIDISVMNGFAAKIKTSYHIVNADTNFEDIHIYNLMYQVNQILQHCMAETFLQIYYDSLDIL